MKKKFIMVIATFSILNLGIKANAADTTTEILKLMPNVTRAELSLTIEETANSLEKSKEEISNQILAELKHQKELSEQEKKEIEKKGNSKATYTLAAGRNNGDIFYEPASTLFVEHGHVGTYWTGDIIVESMPGDGVRSLSRSKKKVASGSKIFTLSGVSSTTKNDASNWAFGRKGESYSYNFATNRETSHYGAKNCSKLVWSAYMVEGNLDIDANKGLGVYPKDILNYSKSSVYKSY